jgi:lipopolysaccharide/colanic/teichoic acid biosynthesis glycosyltransferase
MSERLPTIVPTKRLAGNIVPRHALSTSEVLDQELFLRMLCLERKRAERSSRRFVLMLLESDRLLKVDNDEPLSQKILHALAHSTRETDIKGWYEEGSVIGIIFTETGAAEGTAVARVLLTRITHVLCSTLRIADMNEIRLSFHVFPEDTDSQDPCTLASSPFYPDLRLNKKSTSRFLKRSVDIAGSLFVLILLSPVLLIIAVAVMLSSRGPSLFRQKRVGQFGKTFTFLKFRSMYVCNDDTIHKQYVKRLIAGTTEADLATGQANVYKLTNDPRITPLGRLLRKTSLDELPQLLNVLRGEMSLVGPRPPIPYEFECYSIWQKRRLLTVKPGITGLWQVGGRSRVNFDDMVRLDLKYASTWSLWMDIKILLRTPRAVFSGNGAY